jgi:Kdo2-lipid IVA lauroyltransferase/acyltransferase
MGTVLGCYLVYLLVRALMGFFRVLPRRLSSALIDLLAGLVYSLDSRHRHIAQVNLRIAFPTLSRAARESIARRSFQNIARNILELSRLPLLTRSNIASLVRYDDECGLNNLQLAQARGKPILYITGHFGAWELLPVAHAIYGHPLAFVTRPLDNVPLERFLVQLRNTAGNETFYKKNAARHILKSLGSGGSVGILMDQNTSLQEGIFVDFFGIPAATTTGVALFALRTDATVLPGYLTPMRGGRYTIKFLPPIDLVRTGNLTRDLKENTGAFNRVIESIVREQPESWLWGHKRWKNQPPENPQDLYALSESELEQFLAHLAAG